MKITQTAKYLAVFALGLAVMLIWINVIESYTGCLVLS